jgi:chromosome segregation ATPase
MYENEFEELNRQLREERERIFKLVEMHAEAVRQRDESMATLREKAAETAKIRRQMYDLRSSVNAYKKDAENLRGMLEGLTPQMKTVF